MSEYSTVVADPEKLSIQLDGDSLLGTHEKIGVFIIFFLENSYSLTFLSILTIWSIFSDDIRLAATTKTADLGFEIVISMIFFIFLIDMILRIVFEKDYFTLPIFLLKAFSCNYPAFSNSEQDIDIYTDDDTSNDFFRISHKPSFSKRLNSLFIYLKFGSFYFWVDLISVLSILIEVPWISGEYFLASPVQFHTAKSLESTRLVLRFLRLFRLIRLIRFSKLIRKSAELHDAAYYSAFYGKHSEFNDSHIGAAMTELSIRRVMVLVLALYIVIPLLTIQEVDNSWNLSVNLIHQLAILNYSDPSAYEAALNSTLSYTIETLPVIEIKLNDNLYYYNSDLFSSLRHIDMVKYYIYDSNIDTLVIFNQNLNVYYNACFSMYATLFIMFVLASGTYFFSHDVNRLVIVPIEQMVTLVKKISTNPLGVEYKYFDENDGFIEGMETTILLSTITKIAGLMRVGFGEAGASIIARNLADSDSGMLNLMEAGNQIYSIFGFCDIRQFTNTTECLQEEVMLFVNRIAYILHNIIVQYSGAANKNIGDAFLLTWKIDDMNDFKRNSELADQALLSFCKTVIALSVHQKFICDFSINATSRLYTRFPGYSIRMGFGLHVGWAIEGAIGSNRKIDTSYLSPNVTFTEYLESSTKKYGVSIILSQPFYELLSDNVKQYCRQIDCVKFGNDNPIGIYTYDVNISVDWDEFQKKQLRNMKSRKPIGIAIQGSSRKRHSTRSSFEDYNMNGSKISLSTSQHGDIENFSRDVPRSNMLPELLLAPYHESVWAEDEYLVEQRKGYEDVLKTWNVAINSFLKGNWVLASNCCREVLQLTDNRDGPSIQLLKTMREYSGGTWKAPHDWSGYVILGDSDLYIED